MAEEVEITHGGIVAVDPDDLRALAGRIRADAAAVQVARGELLGIPALVEASGLAGRLPTGAITPLWAITPRLDAIDVALVELAGATSTMADIFEIAELEARRAMPGPTDPELVKRSLHRVDEILARNPGVTAAAQRLLEDWAREAFAGFAAAPGTPLSESRGTVLDMLSMLSPALRLGLVSAGTTEATLAQGALLVLMLAGPALGQGSRTPLTPTPGVVRVDGIPAPGAPGRGTTAPRPGDLLLTRTRTPAVVSGGAGAGASASTAGAGALPVPRAPSTLGAAVARIPAGEAPQVRVERYALADGSTRFLAYVDGTRPGRSDSEPWDMGSNLQAYVNHEESDSYKATVAALRAAGADATTPVDLVGYSQGGMNADLVAQAGEFDVRGVFTVGSPIEPALPVDVLDVAVRHTDDPVAGLTGGGRPAGRGSSESLVITRAAAPGHGLDAGFPAHRLDAYQETVRRAEQSGDPRMDAIRDHFAAYDGAALVESTDFTATRVSEDG